jgi:hypothetical protein
MIGTVTLRSPAIPDMRATSTIAPTNWKRRTIEVLVSLLAFAVWGTLAYKGFFRLLYRYEGVDVGGHWLLDAASLLVGVSGSIAGASALWALAMRALGRTPSSLVGAPDDDPADRPKPRV